MSVRAKREMTRRDRREGAGRKNRGTRRPERRPTKRRGGGGGRQTVVVVQLGLGTSTIA